MSNTDERIPRWSLEDWRRSYEDWRELADPARVGGESGPVADYSFDGGTARDVSGNRHDGLIHNAIPTFGRNRRGLLLAGSGTRVIVPDHKQLQLGRGMTLQGWAYAFSSLPDPEEEPEPDIDEIADPRECVLRGEDRGKGHDSLLVGIKAALERLAAAVELGVADSPEALADAAWVAKYRSRIVFLKRQGSRPDQTAWAQQASGTEPWHAPPAGHIRPPARAQAGWTSVVERFHLQDRVRGVGQIPGAISKLPLDDLLDIALLPEAESAQPPIPARIMPMPSLLAKIGSYGLDINPRTGQPYVVISVGKRLFTARAKEPIPFFSWVFLAATYDGHVLRLYVNGEQAAVTAVSKAAERSTSGYAQVGNPPPLNPKDEGEPIDTVDSPVFLGDYPFDRGISEGVIDEIKIYDYARSPRAIRRDYYRGKPLASFPFSYGLTQGFAGNDEYGSLLGPAAMICESEANDEGRMVGKGHCLQLAAHGSTFAFAIGDEERLWQTPYPVVAGDPAHNSGSIAVQMWMRVLTLRGSSAWPLPPAILFGHKAPPYNPCWLRLDTQGYLDWTIRLKGAEYSVRSPKPLQVDQWTAVAASYDEFSGVMKLYVDGRVIASKDLPYLGCPLEISWSRNFYVGGPGVYSPVVRVSEITLYPFARTDAEVARNAHYYDVPCERKERGLLPPGPGVGVGLGPTLDDLDQPVPGRSAVGPGVIDCTRAICNDEQWREWQQSVVLPGDPVVGGTLGGGSRVPNCAIAICTPEAYAAWLIWEQQRRDLAAVYQEPYIDCSRALCNDAQVYVYQRRLWEQYQAALSHPLPSQPDASCGPLNCCPPPATLASTADDASSSGSAGTDATGNGDSSDEDDSSKFNITGNKEQDEAGNIFITNTRWKGGMRDGQVVHGEYIYTEYYTDGTSKSFDAICYEGDCLILTGESDETGGPGGDGLTSGGAVDSEGTPSGGTDPGPGGLDSSGAAITEQAIMPTPDPLADASRSPWDGWGGTGDFGFGSGTGLGGGGTGGTSQGGTGVGTYGTRDRGTLSLRDATEILVDPSGLGTQTFGAGVGFTSPHVFLIPVGDTIDGIIRNPYIDQHIPPGQLGGTLLPGPSPDRSDRAALRRTINDALAEVSGRGGADTISGGLIDLLHKAFDDMVKDRAYDPTSDQKMRLTLDVALGFVPFVNDARDLYELLSGKDMITGKNLGAWERAVTALGLAFGSGVYWQEALDGAIDLLKRKGRRIRGSVDEVERLAREELERIMRLGLSTEIKPRALTPGQRNTAWGRYQVRATGGRPVEYEVWLQKDPFLPNMGPSYRKERAGTLRIDGFTEQNGRHYAIEAKYLDPRQDVPSSHHALKLGGPEGKLDQAKRYVQFLKENPSIEGVIYRCNTQELADFYRRKVIAHMPEPYQRRIRVEVWP